LDIGKKCPIFGIRRAIISDYKKLSSGKSEVSSNVQFCPSSHICMAHFVAESRLDVIFFE
jgi:hypothetical protein